MDALTPEEKRAVATMQRLARRWPQSLWLFSGNGSLGVLRCGAHGERVMTEHGGVDPAYCIATIDIPNDGGDW